MSVSDNPVPVYTKRFVGLTPRLPVRVCTNLMDESAMRFVRVDDAVLPEEPGDHHYIMVQNSASPPTPLHSHEFYEIAVIRSGHMALTGREETIELTRGDVLLFAPEAVHGYQPYGAVCYTDVFLLPEWMLDDLRLLWQVKGLVRRLLAHALFNTALGSGVIRLKALPTEMAVLESELMCMEDASKSPDPCLAMINGCFLKILGVLNQAYQRDFPRDDLPIRPEMWEAVNQMELMLRLGSPFDPTALAEALGISIRGLERMFRRYADLGPAEYYQQRRVSRARRMLSAPGVSITQVAHDLGFTDGAHFTKVFKRFTGCTPKEYRERQESEPPSAHL